MQFLCEAVVPLHTDVSDWLFPIMMPLLPLDFIMKTSLLQGVMSTEKHHRNNKNTNWSIHDNREDWLWDVCIYLQCSLHYYYCIIIRMSYPRDATFDDVYNRVVGDRNVGPIPCTSGYINNLKHLKSLLLDTRILDWDTTLFSWKFDWSIIWSVETGSSETNRWAWIE